MAYRLKDLLNDDNVQPPFKLSAAKQSVDEVFPLDETLTPTVLVNTDEGAAINITPVVKAPATVTTAKPPLPVKPSTLRGYATISYSSNRLTVDIKEMKSKSVHEVSLYFKDRLGLPVSPTTVNKVLTVYTESGDLITPEDILQEDNYILFAKHEEKG
jgi:hypothetical protein